MLPKAPIVEHELFTEGEVMEAEASVELQLGQERLELEANLSMYQSSFQVCQQEQLVREANLSMHIGSLQLCKQERVELHANLSASRESLLSCQQASQQKEVQLGRSAEALKQKDVALGQSSEAQRQKDVALGRSAEALEQKEVELQHALRRPLECPAIQPEVADSVEPRACAQHVSDSAEAEASNQSLRDVGESQDPDSFTALWQASLHSLRLLGHVGTFAAETLAAEIWPWPVETLSVIPDFDAERFAENLAYSLANASRAAASMAADALPGQALGPAMPELLRAGQHASMALSRQAEASVAIWLTAFRVRFPEHSHLGSGREPALVLLMLSLLAVVVAWQLYGLCMLFRFWVGVPCRRCWLILRCCLRSCRSNVDRLDGEWEANGGEMINIRVHFEQGLGEAELRMRENNSVVLAQGWRETEGKFANGKLLWDTGEVWTRQGAAKRDHIAPARNCHGNAQSHYSNDKEIVSAPQAYTGGA